MAEEGGGRWGREGGTVMTDATDAGLRKMKMELPGLCV